ncbi:hypothetical protein FOA43_001907 [Brettanomyces nanus]|uniref:LicD/FKTN/FKRP nucleotidyltransferase domain-containing protein n=1 Tax=Eeniella nana TaxID=13502 RepID=A0A875RZI2_EENNA|nr:uncharacterized protein FOA43_001907 [Brettanomyces nanus]QPG74576.1 hypothetical protein FOA43_001907 [Brettanomyces nanus]
MRDWMNLGHAGVLLHAYDDLYPHNDKTYSQLWESLKSHDSSRVNHTPVVTQLMRSDTWLYGFMDPPERIQVITSQGFYTIPVAKKRLMGEQELWDTYHGVSGSEHSEASLAQLDLHSVVKELDTINLKYNDPVDWNKPIPEQYNIPHEEFKWSLDDEIEKLESKSDKSSSEITHLQKLKDCRDTNDRAMFFFPVNYLEHDRYLKGDHTNFPFFQSVVEPTRRRSHIHHLMRNYAKFMRQAGYNYWVFSGNAISWYFNGNNMPWDEDIDIRMTVQEMNRMSLTHNATLVVENPEEGDGLYYFTISPWFGGFTRTGNHIDSRFVDIKTGLYIDITCLYEVSESKEEILQRDAIFDSWGIKKEYREEYLSNHAVINDKNNNWYWEDNFSRNFRTLFEGTMTYMPYEFAKVLVYNYGRDVLTRRDFDSWNYYPETGMWVNGRLCEPKKYQKVFDYGEAFNSDGKLTLKGACDRDALLDEWTRTHISIDMHKEELDLFTIGDKGHLKYSEKDLPIYWSDEFTDIFNYYETSGDSSI